MHGPDAPAEAYVAEVLGIPCGLRVESIIAVGYPGEEKRPHPIESLPFEKVHAGRFGVPYGRFAR